MTLDDLTTYEQHEYDIYADSLIYSREYQVACQYCPATAKGTWEQLERVEGWILAKRETCPKCAAKRKAEQAAKCQCGHSKEQHNNELRDEDGSVEAVICNDYACAKGGGCWGYAPHKATDLDKPTYDRRGVCDHCHRTDMWVTDHDSEKLCERCVQDYDDAQLFIAAIGAMKNTPNDNLILRAAIAFLMFIAGIAFMWQLTEPDDATTGMHRAKQAIGVTK